MNDNDIVKCPNIYMLCFYRTTVYNLNCALCENVCGNACYVLAICRRIFGVLLSRYINAPVLCRYVNVNLVLYLLTIVTSLC